MSARKWSPEVVMIGDRIAALTAGQAALLGRYLADVHGILPPAVTEILPPPEPDLIVKDGKAEPTVFDVVLDGYDVPRKIAVIRAVRERFALGLKDALALVQAAPTIVRERLSREEAEQLQAQLEMAGAKVSLRPSDDE